MFKMRLLLIFLQFSVIIFCGDVTSAAPTLPINASDCEAYKGEVCVNLHDCEFFAELITRSFKDQRKYVIQIIRDNQCGFNPDMSPKVCCKQAQAYSIMHFPDEVEAYTSMNWTPKDCGFPSILIRSSDENPKAALMQHPWMAQLFYEKDDKLNSHCAGTLINERYVLTAAHCVFKRKLRVVRLGEYDLSTEEDCDDNIRLCSPPVQDFTIEDIIVHPGYNLIYYVDDIALIRLNASANIREDNVKPICLPLGEYKDATLNKIYGLAIGWGKTENGFKRSHLLKSKLPIWITSMCRKIYTDEISITDKQICAGSFFDKGAGGGDTGGPLIVSTDGGWKDVIYGITSYVPNQRQLRGQPWIYTKVDSYMEWILKNMKVWEKYNHNVDVLFM